MNYRLPNLNRFGQTLEEFYNSPEQLENCNCSPGQWEIFVLLSRAVECCLISAFVLSDSIDEPESTLAFVRPYSVVYTRFLYSAVVRSAYTLFIISVINLN